MKMTSEEFCNLYSWDYRIYLALYEIENIIDPTIYSDDQSKIRHGYKEVYDLEYFYNIGLGYVRTESSEYGTKKFIVGITDYDKNSEYYLDMYFYTVFEY
jgi:hypothetical protein